MAGIATHVKFAVRELAIDFMGHLQHVARGGFVVLVVAGEIALYVTEIAFHSERDGEGAHGRHYILRLEDLQILRRGVLVLLGESQCSQNEEGER